MRKQLLLILPVILFLGFFLFSQEVQAKEFKIKIRSHASVCKNSGPESARCHARVVVKDTTVTPEVTSGPSGYGPSDFRLAYGLPSGVTIASGATVPVLAIVDAYDHPNIMADLNTYSSQFGLPSLPLCSGSVSTSTVPCFSKVDQRGGSTYPAVNSGWALEISLDVEVAHAICPNCSLLLVEADSNSYANLMAGVDRAVTLGAKVISNSYGSGEFSGEKNYDFHFNHPGVAITFSSGDSGYGVEYPAASRYVTAVGGTTLFLNADSSYQSEAVWAGAGSGCSSYELKPSFQHDSGCSRRTVADVAADADPSTGAAVYDSVPYSGQSGWFQVGGTSLASPIIAGVYALSGNIPSNILANSLPYSLGNYSSTLHDITIGNNGRCRRFSYLCTGVIGYDGPTGQGTPKGSGAF